MPHVETPDEIAESMADLIGIYGAHDEDCTDHQICRCCFVLGLTERIRESVKNESMLKQGGFAP